MSTRRCSFRQHPEDSPCPAAAFYLLELASLSGRECEVCLCREHVHKAWTWGQHVLAQRFPNGPQKLRSIRLMKLSRAALRKKETTTCVDERRASPRSTASFEVAYLFGQSLTFTQALDVSHSGIAFRSRSRFDIGTQLTLKLIPSVPFSTSSIPVETTVKRADGKVVGVQFSFHSDDDRLRLMSFLAHCAR